MDFRGPWDNKDFYYCVKIKTRGFSTCGGFEGENEFILWFWGCLGFSGFFFVVFLLFVIWNPLQK